MRSFLVWVLILGIGVGGGYFFYTRYMEAVQQEQEAVRRYEEFLKAQQARPRHAPRVTAIQVTQDEKPRSMVDYVQKKEPPKTQPQKKAPQRKAPPAR